MATASPSARQYPVAAPAPLVILAIGNTLLTDEAVGACVLEELRRRGLQHVELVDGGTVGFALLGHVERAAALIVVDAGGLDAPAGTVRSFEGPAMDEFLSGAGRRRTVHEMGLLDLLAAARLRDVLPLKRALVCVQPSTVAWGLELTSPVAAAVPAAADEAQRICRQWAA